MTGDAWTYRMLTLWVQIGAAYLANMYFIKAYPEDTYKGFVKTVTEATQAVTEAAQEIVHEEL